MRRNFFTGGVAALVLPAHALEEPPPQRREFVAPHMGTLWRLVFFENDEARARAVRNAAWARLGALNARLSDYLDDSELSRLSRDGRLDAPGDDLRRLLARARELAGATGGAFDITVGPLVRLWRAARKEKRLPDPAAIEQARRLVDWRAVELTAEAAIFHTPGGRLDLGGIGKGFAQDEVLRLLREQHGIAAALIDAGGGVSVGAAPPGRTGWTAGVDPGDDADAQVVLSLRQQSLATSGDTRQFVEIGGVRYSHIVDPSTGLGLTDQTPSHPPSHDPPTLSQCRPRKQIPIRQKSCNAKCDRQRWKWEAANRARRHSVTRVQYPALRWRRANGLRACAALREARPVHGPRWDVGPHLPDRRAVLAV